MKSFGLWGNILLLVGVVVLAVTPLMLKSDATFGGADGQAEDMIAAIAPDYEPWFANLFEPPSGEIESLLFMLQAAIGSGLGNGLAAKYQPRQQ